jgi:zinc protease
MSSCLATNTSPSLPGPQDVSRFVLPNGVVVLVRANFNSPSVVVSGYLPAGSLGDPDDRLGLAMFVSNALMRGTEQRDFHQIHAALEDVAASLSFGVTHHIVSFTGRALREDLSMLLDLLAEVLRRPIFPEEQIEKLRAQLLTALAIRAQDTAEMAGLTFDQILFNGHPYSRPTDGWPQTVQAIQRADLLAFHRRYYGPRGLVLAVVGAVEAAEVLERVEHALGDWQNPEQAALPALPPFQPLARTIRKKVRLRDKAQSDLVVGTAGPRRNDPDFMAASLGNSVLGQFGLAGRIGDSVREKAGLAYYAYSSLNSGPGPASWEISAGVNPANVARALQLIRREIENFVNRGVSEEELADSQANFIGRLPLSLESNAGVASALLTIERFDLGLDYYLRYADLVRAVTPQEVLAVAQKYFDPHRLAIAIAGP